MDVSATVNLSDGRLLIPYIYRSIAVPKALQTSAQPGMTRAVSTRLKLALDPLIYSFDSPGVMLPFIGRGEKGAERGVKLALIGECTTVYALLPILDDLTHCLVFIASTQRVSKRASMTSKLWHPI